MSQTQLTTPSSPNGPKRGLIRRLLNWRSVLVTSGVVTVLTIALKVFNWGIAILDWADRFEFVRARKGLLFDAFAWLLSPIGLNVLLLSAVSVTLLAVFLIVNPIYKATAQASSVEPLLEIISPFNDEEVGLYEIVRGRVFPPDRELQVLVYAPDKKWYPQKRVDVKGSFWSVKCQFGQLEGKGGDIFKIAAVLGTQLDEEMWYGNLPDEGVKSNVVRIRRQETTIEQRLLMAQADLVEADKRTNDQRRQKETLLTELEKREADLAELKTLRDMRLTQAQDISSHVIVTHVHAGDLILDGDENSGPCVTLGLRIKNESLYKVSIDHKDISGSLAFANQNLEERIIQITTQGREPIKDLEPFEVGYITLMQPLRIFEAERIKSLPDSHLARFALGLLDLPLTADDGSVKPQKLRLSNEFEHIPRDAFRVTKSVDSKDKV